MQEDPRRLEFSEMHIDKPQCYWEYVLWTEKTKLKLFVTSVLCSQMKIKAFKGKNTILKHTV